MRYLKNVPLFADLPAQELTELETRLTLRRYRRRTVLIEKGDPPTSMYIIVEGRVRVYIADENQKEVTLNTQGPGEYFGELAILMDSPRTASVMTTEDSAFYVMEKDEFKDFLAAHPRSAFALIQSLARRVADLTDEVSGLALNNVYGRVRNLLVSQAQQQNGRKVVAEKMTQQDIARRVGASREMVSIIFKDLRAGGYITVEGSHIFINKHLPAQW
nr:Crp/Fnr family transcriptional regulator [uncultured bacterium]